MEPSPSGLEAQPSPKVGGSLQGVGERNRCRQPASRLGTAFPVSCSSPTLSCSSSCRGTFQDAYRTISPEEEWKLQLKGEKERKLAAAKELRLQQQQERRLEEQRFRIAREAATIEHQEAQEQAAKECRLKRLQDIESKREEELLRAQERASRREAEAKAAQKPWSLRRLSPDARRLLGMGSREEDWSQELKRCSVEGDKDRRIREAKLAEETARRERLQREEQVRLSYCAHMTALESDRERKRQKELLKRASRKEEFEARRDRHLKQKENREQEAKARAVFEFQQLQKDLYLRQRAEEQNEIGELKAKGAKELAIRAAKDARQRQRELARKSESKVRMKQEVRETFLQEIKEQQVQNEKIRRALDIDLRRERAEEARREREEIRRQEEDFHSQLAFPAPPRRRVASPGPLTANLDALLSARAMSHSRSDGHLLGCFSAR